MLQRELNTLDQACKSFVQRFAMRLEVAERVAADALLVSVALSGAHIAWLIGSTLWRAPSPAAFDAAAWKSFQGYVASLPFVLSVCLLTFGAFGFYTRGRAYRGRYKALVIVQAVSVAFLVIGTLTYLLFGLAYWLPRPVWALAWLFTIAGVGAARLAAGMWRTTVFAEATHAGRPVRRRARNVVVIGGAGYIGSVLARQLLDSGHEVTVLDALLYGDEGVRELFAHPRFRLIEGDFRDLRTVVRAMEHQDAVVHLGGLVGDPACAVDEELTLQINTTATRMIAEVARGFGVSRFVFASSCSVYGASDLLLDERSQLNPVSLYARTKIDGERILQQFGDDAFAPTNLRFATLYGLSPRARFDLVVNLLTALAVVDGRITIHGGDQWRPFVHVSDVARAIVTVLNAPIDAVKYQTFNVGSDDQNMRIGDLGRILGEFVPDLEIVTDEGIADPRNYRVSFARIRRHLGFEPRWTLRDGIVEMMEAVRDGAFADIRDERFNNLRGLGTTLHYLTNGNAAKFAQLQLSSLSLGSDLTVHQRGK